MLLKPDQMPQHVAIIMDGNGRWAKSHGLDRSQGHIEGAKRVEEIVTAAQGLGIKALTLYTFSTENWNRPEPEVSMIMNMLATILEIKMRKLEKDNIKFQCLGHRDPIPKALLQVMDEAMQRTKNNTSLVVNLAFNYGSRGEIVDAVRKIAQSVKNQTLRVEDICEETISQALYTKNLPDPDLLIRTSGEKRISNFLLWQLSYAELYFTDRYWPDFTKEEFEKAILDFQGRERRYGGLRKSFGVMDE